MFIIFERALLGLFLYSAEKSLFCRKPYIFALSKQYAIVFTTICSLKTKKGELLMNTRYEDLDEMYIPEIPLEVEGGFEEIEKEQDEILDLVDFFSITSSNMKGDPGNDDLRKLAKKEFPKSNNKEDLDYNGSPYAYLLREMEKYHLLSREEEMELTKTIWHRPCHQLINKKVPGKETSKCRKVREAFDKLVGSNLPLVISIAKKYQKRDLEFLDLISEGSLGLIRTIGRFDYRLGHRFGTLAIWWIHQAITKAIHDKSRAIRLPVHIWKAGKKFQQALWNFKMQGKNNPSDENLRDATGLKISMIKLLRGTHRRIVSLDAKRGEDDENLLAFIGDEQATTPEKSAANIQLSEKTEELLTSLYLAEARILRMRFGFGIENGVEKTLKEISQTSKLSDERIRQIEKGALKKLKQSSGELLKDLAELLEIKFRAEILNAELNSPDVPSESP
jgi:RNA polymerase sigma factor (sigma-70 family)